VRAYRQRSGYTQAIATLTDAETRQRRDYWLGEFDSPESRERYHRIIAEREHRGRRLPPPDFDAAPTQRPAAITIVEVVRDYWRWAVDYYRPKHAQALDGALKLLRHFYGRTPAAEFGPKKLRLLRDHMIRGGGSCRKPWSREYINSQVQRIRHMFKWAAGHELVPASVHQSLCTLEPLRRGRCDAREGRKSSGRRSPTPRSFPTDRTKSITISRQSSNQRAPISPVSSLSFYQPRKLLQTSLTVKPECDSVDANGVRPA